MKIDPTTAADLEIFDATDSRGGLLQLIDTTDTSHGAAALKRRFRSPSSDPAEIRDVQDAVRFLQRNPGLVRLDGASLDAVARYLGSNVEVSRAGPIAARFEDAWLTIRYRSLRGEIDDGIAVTAELFSRTNRMCGSASRMAPPALVERLTSGLLATADAVLTAVSQRGLVLVDRALRADLREAIGQALDALGELDALSAMARATTEMDWVIPELVESDEFTLEADGVYHPFVKRPVPNPVRLSGGEPLLFLTGPNMAGKTTYLRSVAVVALLAHVGMGVPAKRVRLSPIDALFVSLNPADNLREGLSYFLAEVLRVKAAATLLAEGRRTLVIFDEVFKGTNVRDALDASGQVIEAFARARRSGCIFSSHLAELVEVFGGNPSIQYRYFDGDVVAGAPHYGYELREGVSDRRLGLHLLQQARVPELLARIA